MGPRILRITTRAEKKNMASRELLILLQGNNLLFADFNIADIEFIILAGTAQYKKRQRIE